MLFKGGARMGLNFQWLRQAADHVDLTDEVLPGETVVEVIGKGRVLIEGHHGVLAYCDSRVCVKVCYGVAEIVGSNLKLSNMHGYKLVISGYVNAVNLHWRER